MYINIVLTYELRSCATLQRGMAFVEEQRPEQAAMGDSQSQVPTLQFLGMDFFG